MKAHEVVQFTKKNYGQLAAYARGLIVGDMERGVLQNGRHRYKSKKYKAEKAASFEPGRPKELIGQSLNTYTRSVNLILTGETKNRIRPEGRKTEGLLVFERADIIRQNEARGYVITTLNPTNREKARKFLDRIVDMKIKKYESKPIKIKTIG